MGLFVGSSLFLPFLLVLRVERGGEIHANVVHTKKNRTNKIPYTRKTQNGEELEEMGRWGGEKTKKFIEQEEFFCISNVVAQLIFFFPAKYSACKKPPCCGEVCIPPQKKKTRYIIDPFHLYYSGNPQKNPPLFCARS